MGTGRGFDGRLRVGLEAQWRSESVAEVGALEREHTQDQRLTLGAVYAPAREIQIALRVPLVRRVYTSANLARSDLTHLGDLELRGRWQLFQDRAFAPRHLFGVSGGVRLPTGPEVADPDGPLIEDAQPGVGAWVPLTGLWYAWSAHPWSLWSSAGVELPTTGYGDRRPGATALASVTLQHQLGTMLAVSAGLDGRLSATDTVNGITDNTTGGSLLMVAGGVTAQVRTDWLVYVVARAPVLDGQAAQRREGWMWISGLTVDL